VSLRPPVDGPLPGLAHDHVAASLLRDREVLEGQKLDDLAYERFKTRKAAVPENSRSLFE
jgi:hypothetical protein